MFRAEKPLRVILSWGTRVIRHTRVSSPTQCTTASGAPNGSCGLQLTTQPLICRPSSGVTNAPHYVRYYRKFLAVFPVTSKTLSFLPIIDFFFPQGCGVLHRSTYARRWFQDCLLSNGDVCVTVSEVPTGTVTFRVVYVHVCTNGLCTVYVLYFIWTIEHNRTVY